MVQNKDLANQEKFLLAGLKNLREGLSALSMDIFVVKSIEMLMTIERNDYLEEMKHKGAYDKGNGTYPRSFKSLSRNALIVNVPRTRTGEFKPFALEFLKYSQEQINELVLTLYRKGMTTRDISAVLKEFFSEEISYATVSNLAGQFNQVRKAWEASFLEKHYKVAYADAIYITVRRGDSYSKEATHIIYGVREDNKRELLYLGINPTESAQSWEEGFISIKNRGVEKIDFIVADGFKGLPGEVHKHFPEAKFQQCVAHKMRATLNKMRPLDKPSMAEDLKGLFNHFDNKDSTKEYPARLENFVSKWVEKYPYISNWFDPEDMNYYFSYTSVPLEVRRTVYTTNSIESLNKQIRKATKNKLSFEKPERLLDFVFIVVKQFEEENWMRHPVTVFSTWQTQ